MIKREQDWVLKLGEYTHEYGSTESWVGGAPVGMGTAAMAVAPVGTTFSFHGVPIRSKLCVDAKDGGLLTLLRTPEDITIFKGTADDDTSGAGADPFWPWDPNVTYAIGDLLRPTTSSSGGITYSVWTNAIYPTESGKTGYCFVYPAIILDIEGSGSAPTALRIYVEPHVKIVV